jgi:hypothetical protein
LDRGGDEVKIERNNILLEQLPNGNYVVAVRDAVTKHVSVGMFLSASEMDDLLHVMVGLWKQTDQYKAEAANEDSKP